MSTPETETTAIQKTDAPNRRRRRRKRDQRRQVVCQICHQPFAAITAEHLRTHGYTLTRYRRAFKAYTRPRRDYTGSGAPDRADDPLAMATRIVSDPRAIREMADEVQEAIFSGPLRDRFRLGLTALVARRLEMHGKAAAAMDAVRAELAEAWRLTRGGPNGAPTPTKDLVAIASVLGAEVKQGEELLIKTVKLCLEEWRTNKGLATLDGGLLDRYSGEGEVLPVPPELNAQDRETMRTLWGMFDKAITARRTVIDVQAVTSTTDDPLPSPTDVHDSPGASPGPMVTPPAGEDFDPSALGPDEPF